MTICRQDAIDASEARTQGAFVAALRARLRTTHHSVQRGLGSQVFMMNRPNK